MASDYGPLFFASAVLPDGRVVVEGGEYNQFGAGFTNLGAIYDPVANTWTTVNPPTGWSAIGDASSIVLSNGQMMLANAVTRQAALFNPLNLTWTPTGSGKFDINDEETWTLLPNGKVLTVDCYVQITSPTERITNSTIPSAGPGPLQARRPCNSGTRQPIAVDRVTPHLK